MAEPCKSVGFVWVQGRISFSTLYFLFPFLFENHCIQNQNMYDMSITYYINILLVLNMSVYHQSQITPIPQDQPVNCSRLSLSRCSQEPAAAKAEDPKAKLLGNPRRCVAPSASPTAMWMIPEVRGGKTEICRWWVRGPGSAKFEVDV